MEPKRVRQNLGRVTRAVLFSLTGFLACVGFQNCSGYAANQDILFSNEALNTCIGLTCAEDNTLLRLNINNDNPAQVKNASVGTACGADDSTCVDLGGACESGGYPDNLITYQISGGTVQVQETALQTKCVDGRFSAQVPLPTGYDFTAIHVIRLTIYGVDGGARVTSQSGGNFREINLISYN